MDKNNDKKFETLKEEPVNIPDNTRSFIGTPAHPIPKYLPKKIALIIIILLTSFFVIGGIFQLIKIKNYSSSTKSTSTDEFCGGIAAIKCPQGYKCKLDGKYPDAGGTCFKN